MDLSLTTRSQGDQTILGVRGEVDVYSAPVLRERLLELVEAGKRTIVVDLSAVEFLDSTGLGVLVGAHKRLRENDGELVLVCGQDRILRIFRITGLESVFAIHATVDEAVASVG